MPRQVRVDVRLQKHACDFNMAQAGRHHERVGALVFLSSERPTPWNEDLHPGIQAYTLE